MLGQAGGVRQELAGVRHGGGQAGGGEDSLGEGGGETPGGKGWRHGGALLAADGGHVGAGDGYVGGGGWRAGHELKQEKSYECLLAWENIRTISITLHFIKFINCHNKSCSLKRQKIRRLFVNVLANSVVRIDE